MSLFSFQARVADWMHQCFGLGHYKDITERGDRLLEEVLELLQSKGYDPARVPTLTNYVYGRSVGDPAQEVGGVMVTLAGLCCVAGIDLDSAAHNEIRRIEQPTVMQKIRAKQALKNGLHDDPLPGGANEQGQRPVPMLAVNPRATWLLHQARSLLERNAVTTGDWIERKNLISMIDFELSGNGATPAPLPQIPNTPKDDPRFTLTTLGFRTLVRRLAEGWMEQGPAYGPSVGWMARKDCAEQLLDIIGTTPLFEQVDACDLPPTGWQCSRGKGHPGPCAATEAHGPGLYARFLRGVCRIFGHGRDWPEMDTCGRCGTYLPLEIEHPDTLLLDAIASNYLDVNSYTIPTGQGDADIGWQVVRHRSDGTRHSIMVDFDDVRRALDQAIEELGK